MRFSITAAEMRAKIARFQKSSFKRFASSVSAALNVSVCKGRRNHKSLRALGGDL